MKNKKKILYLLALALVMMASVFVSPKISAAVSHLIINEIQITGGSGKTSNDFIEIYNPTSGTINLKGYRLVKRTKNGSSDTTIKSWTADTIVQKKDYYLWANSGDGFAEGLDADSATSQTIANDNGVALRYGAEDSGEIVDSVGWGGCANIFVESSPFATNPNANKSLERIDFKDSDDNLNDFRLLNTPSPTCSQPPPSEEYKAKIRINEIVPNPKSDEKEYIELYNSEEEDVNLANYYLRDDSSTGKYIFPAGKEIKKKNYLTILKDDDFSFALNDNGDETVTLYDPTNKSVDRMFYKNSKDNYSLSYDGSKWRWTKFLTPSGENKFEKTLESKIKMDDNIYADIYADFEAKSGDAIQKFTWDFGDGHKSYKKETRHKYDDSNLYSASLKISGDGEENEYFFTVNVEDYSAPKVKIIGFSPNPKGKDADNEWMEIKNNSKHEVNLKNWSIATGAEKLYNHPIRKDFKIKPGKSKKLKRKICAFSLGNKKSKIELRSPDGKTVQKIKYNREKDKIEEDEIYGLDGKKWEWEKPNNIAKGDLEVEPPIGGSTSKEIPSDNATVKKENAVPALDFEVQANLGKISINPVWNKKKKNQIILLSYNTKIKTPESLLDNGRVLGIYTQKNTPPEKHWAVSLIDNILKKINLRLNWVLNNI